MSVPCVAEHDLAEARELFTFEALEASYRECRRRKRGKLASDLQRGSYQPRRSVCFLTAKPKLREIIASDFRDRVVHHFLVKRLEPIFERIFIHDSFASRKGKGTPAAQIGRAHV